MTRIVLLGLGCVAVAALVAYAAYALWHIDLSGMSG